MTRRAQSVLVAAIALVAGVASLRPAAQSQPRADAEFLRTAYDRYSTMRRSSPYQSVNWSYLGPTNVSGRATDLAVADKDGRRRIYVGYATSLSYDH